MINRLHNYDTDDSQSTDEAFGDDADYSEDPSLLRSSGGDAQAVDLGDHAPHGQPTLSNRFVEGLEEALDEDMEQLEALSLQEFIALDLIDLDNDELEDFNDAN